MNKNNTGLKPTIILDIDDVLCVSTPYGGFDVMEALGRRQRGQHDDLDHILSKVFVKRAVDILRKAHEGMNGHVSYVISSTWRAAFDREAMVQIFKGAGAGLVADSLREGDAWCTPHLSGENMRSQEIDQWMHTYGQGEQFVIIDDQFSGKSLVDAKSDPSHPWHWNVVLCDEFVGLTNEHLGEILTALKRPHPIIPQATTRSPRNRSPS